MSHANSKLYITVLIIPKIIPNKRHLRYFDESNTNFRYNCNGHFCSLSSDYISSLSNNFAQSNLVLNSYFQFNLCSFVYYWIPFSTIWKIILKLCEVLSF